MTLSSTFSFSDSDAYELQMGRWSRRLAPMFIAFAGIDRAASVLDVGCGTGSLSFYLARNPNIGCVQGVDLSPPYVEHARRRTDDARIAFQVGNACALPFPDTTFDHAFSMLALQFVPQVGLAIQEMRRVARAKGTIAAATWDTRGGFVALRMIFDAAAMVDPNGNEVRAKAYTRPMSRPGELGRAFRESGLAEVVEDMLTIRMDFVSFADFWWPHESREGPVAEYISALTPGTKAKLRETVKLAYLDGEADGPRSYAATAWVVKGTCLARPSMPGSGTNEHIRGPTMSATGGTFETRPSALTMSVCRGRPEVFGRTPK
jgi:SAM-dependent methyltransferase